MVIVYNSLNNNDETKIKQQIRSQFLNIADLRVNQMTEGILNRFTDEPNNKDFEIKFGKDWKIAKVKEI